MEAREKMVEERRRMWKLTWRLEVDVGVGSGWDLECAGSDFLCWESHSNVSSGAFVPCTGKLFGLRKVSRPSTDGDSVTKVWCFFALSLFHCAFCFQGFWFAARF